MTDGGVVELREEPRGRWRWAYAEGSLRIESNRPYATLPQAESAAAAAYPGVPITAAEPRAAAPGEAWAGLGAFLLVVLAAWRGYRRSRR
jgi:hypothetical protein